MGGRVATSAVFLGLRGSPKDPQPSHLARILEDRGRRSTRQAGGRGSRHDRRRRLFGAQACVHAVARIGPVGARTVSIKGTTMHLSPECLEMDRWQALLGDNVAP